MMRSICFLTFFLINLLAYGQLKPRQVFSRVELKADTNVFTLLKNHVVYNDSEHLAFYYNQVKEVAEVLLYPKEPADNFRLSLLPSGDFDIIDSLVYTGEAWRFKVRFKNLNAAQFLNFMLRVRQNEEVQLVKIPLFPYTKTFAALYPDSDELYVGEEKIFELVTNNIYNLKIQRTWTKGNDINYRMSVDGTKLLLHVLPEKTGDRLLDLHCETVRPFLDSSGNMIYSLPVIQHKFNVKASRLKFLSINKADVTLEEHTSNAIEIQLDNHPLLHIGRTYRIEKQADPGGPLVAEIYTRRVVNNDKVLCWLRLYDYHRTSEGYLYLKENDESRFLTNFNITPKTKVNKISILREGGEWSGGNSIYPGETILLKLEGTGLHKGKFRFESLQDISPDSSLRLENVAIYKLHIPADISLQRIPVFYEESETGLELSLKEYQRPHPLDFVMIDYGEGKVAASDIHKPILYDQTIQDVVLSFEPSHIDGKETFYGKQFIELEIKVTGSKGEFLEFKKIDNITVCPSGTRAAFYQEKNCFRNEINLNELLSRKTYDLDDWSKITINVSHRPDKYSEEGYTKKIEIIQKRKMSFDIDVSFPAGLIEKRIGEQGYNAFGGISLAMIGQFSFYKHDRINRFKPYKIGAGFIALNAFNFSDNADDRDVGVLILGSLYPTSRDVKLTFPLYGGFGYLLKNEKFFFLLGPGIRVRL